ncbi:hypothetical protein D3C76_1505460 [compost metagenome]
MTSPSFSGVASSMRVMRNIPCSRSNVSIMPNTSFSFPCAVTAIPLEFGSLASIEVARRTVDVKLLTWLITPTNPFSEETAIPSLTPSRAPRLTTIVRLTGSSLTLMTWAIFQV